MVLGMVRGAARHRHVDLLHAERVCHRSLSYSGWDWRARPGFNLARLFFYRFARLYPACCPVRPADHLSHAVFARCQRPCRASLHPASSAPVAELASRQSSAAFSYRATLSMVSWSLSAECVALSGCSASLPSSRPRFQHSVTRPSVLGDAVRSRTPIRPARSWRGGYGAILVPAGWSDRRLVPVVVWLFTLGVVAFAVHPGGSWPEHIVQQPVGGRGATMQRKRSLGAISGLAAIYTLCATQLAGRIGHVSCSRRSIRPRHGPAHGRRAVKQRGQ